LLETENGAKRGLIRLSSKTHGKKSPTFATYEV
jgi:hypothetical protein